MIYYNLKLALRNLWRHKSFSLINILGLAVGLAGCILIGLYTYNELSYDKFYAKQENIYRINKIVKEKDKQQALHSITPGKLAPAIQGKLPEVKYCARFRPWFNDMLVSYDSLRLVLSEAGYADASFLPLFDFPMIAGNKKTALAEPFTAVITESTSHKYFDDENPIGKTLVTLNNIPVKITGVVKDLPGNSSIQFSLLISWATIEAPANENYFSWMNNWLTQVDYSFVQLRDNADPVKTATKISEILHSNLPERANEYTTYLQPLNEMHLHSSDVLFTEVFKTNSSKLIYTLLLIALFILLIAAFNFINLSTAGALGRAKETGVQKVLGAGKATLLAKFFCESFLLCTFSFLLGISLVVFVLPAFNQLADTNLTPEFLLRPELIWAQAGLLLFISIAAGLYPAFFLTRFKSSDVFRNIVKAGKDSLLRKSLITTQFALSILLIIAVITVKKQLHYITSRDLGFNKEQVVVLKLANTGLENKTQSFSNALRQNPAITAITITNRVPGQGFNGYSIIPEGYREEDRLMASVLETDTEFASAYGIKIKEGRYFSPQLPTDTMQSIVINEAMMRYLNWTNAIGKSFEISGARKGTVIGVIKDMNVGSLREAVQPLAIILKSNPLYLSLKLKSGNTDASLASLENTWKQFESEYPFDYFFLDEKLDHYYQSDTRLMSVLGIFAALAISIACMGLFGLSIYSARQRTKEIGIRKVLGASVLNITALLSKEFVKLVLIAILIASPIAWWAMHNWLQEFAYRIDIGWWIFVAAGIVAVIIALATVSFQAIKTALANPVKSLRSE